MVIFCVRAVLKVGNRIILGLRQNTGFSDGSYGLIGGRVKQGETIAQGVKRKVVEETAIDLPLSMFQLQHVFHRKSEEDEYLVFCFTADIDAFQVNLKNNKVSKYKEVQFFSCDELPKNIVVAHKQAIESIQKNIAYSEHGW